MAECLSKTDELGKEGLLRERVHKIQQDDLIVFRWLEKQISNKKAITACLLVLQGIAYNAELPDVDQEEGT